MWNEEAQMELCDCCGENEPDEICKSCKSVYCEDCVDPETHGCERK